MHVMALKELIKLPSETDNSNQDQLCGVQNYIIFELVIQLLRLIIQLDSLLIAF